jgi:hypothetical protein
MFVVFPAALAELTPHVGHVVLQGVHGSVLKHTVVAFTVVAFTVVAFTVVHVTVPAKNASPATPSSITVSDEGVLNPSGVRNIFWK